MNAAHIARAIAALRAVESLDTTSMDAGSYAEFRVVRRDAAEARKALEAGLESITVPIAEAQEAA